MNEQKITEHCLSKQGAVLDYPFGPNPAAVDIIMLLEQNGIEIYVDENDYHDAKALCERFNIHLPKDFEKFEHHNSALNTFTMSSHSHGKSSSHRPK